ncbi:hypothetical protein MBH78_15450 [Oceanimonas sp. NS1]|nr:hypothetical protein [Oceanimonas sp. NS1]
MFLSYFFIVRNIEKTIAFLPMGKADYINELSEVNWLKLEQPELKDIRIDAVVADLHADIPDDWERFLARCTLAGVPVYHYKQVTESVTGRVRIEHLSENEFGSLQPPVIYSCCKRLLDILAVLVTFAGNCTCYVAHSYCGET